MKWTRRVLLAACILAVLILGAGIVSLYFLPETEFIRTTVQDKLRQVTGQDISIAGIEVERSFSDVVRVQLTGIEAKSPDGKKLFSIKKLHLAPELSALLRRHLVVKSVVVQGLWTSVERDRDGNVTAAFLPAPASSAPTVTPGPGPAEPKPPSATRESAPSTSRESKEFHWSVESVKFEECEAVFTDNKVRPGQPVVFSVHGLNGTLVQRKPEDPMQVDLTAALGPGKKRWTTLHVSGSIVLKSDRSGVVRIALANSMDSMSFEPFEPYLHGSADALKEMGLGKTRVQVEWQMGKPAQADLETVVRDRGADVIPLKVQCGITPSEDLRSIQEITCQVTVKPVPYAFLGKFRPPHLPPLPETGSLEARLKGFWAPEKKSEIEGSVALDNPLPWKLEGVGNRLQVDFRLEPGMTSSSTPLILQGLKISGPDPIASVTWTPAPPSVSEQPGTYTADVRARASWLRELGVRLPKDLALAGGIPLHGTLQRVRNVLNVDAAADLTQTTLRWLPHLEKAAPAKAGISAKGKITLPEDGKDNQPKVDVAVKAHIDSAKVRAVPKGPWLDHASVHFDGRVVSDGGHVNLKGGNLVLRRGQRGEEVLALRADIRELGTKPKFEGTATSIIHPELFTSLALELPKGLAFTGRAPVKAGFVGHAAAFKWTAEGTFTDAGITFEKAFRKPARVAATLKAAGDWADGAVKLDDAHLTLPGVVLAGKGIVRSRQGTFEDLSLEIKKADLKDVARYVPATDGNRLSGPAAASVQITKTGEKVTTRATVRLMGAEFRPDKAAVGFGQIQGTAEINGDSVEVPEVRGVLHGAVEAPADGKASLTGVGSAESLNGSASIKIGKGKIKADRLRAILQPVQILAGSILNPQGEASAKDLLEIESLAADFVLKSGHAYTDNLKLRGGDIKAGAIGTVDLKGQTLDAVVGIYTVMVADGSLGKIPAVRDFVKKHEEFLKNTGLDKAAERFGIKVPGDGKEPEEPQGPVKTPITVILDVKGPTASPKVTPVLERTLDEKKLGKLKQLMEQ
jgi:hypothetical protein